LSTSYTIQPVLDLKAGEWVEVRTQDEILATLDETGRFENVPFMPEMLQFCGRKLQVYKRADKTCEYIHGWSIRRLTNSVHLEASRCDGSGHDGCQASCLIFWKEAWLKRASASIPNGAPQTPAIAAQAVVSNGNGRCTLDKLWAATRSTDQKGETIYSCQALDVQKFTSQMSFWDPRQYVRDLRSGNLSSGFAGNTRGQRALEHVLSFLRLLQASIVGLYNEVQTRRNGHKYPFIKGTASKTPLAVLDLQQGELVQIKTKDEIVASLGADQKNRGLWFDSEMLPYCGGIYRVLRRVHRIIDEHTARMIVMKNPCIVLEGVVCKSDFHRLCPRAIYPYWRESWLKRAVPESLSNTAQECEESHLRS
jgi:hypothetical protein